MKRLALLLLGVTFAQGAEGHCFTRWYYPYPQHCGEHYTRHPARPAMAAPTPARVVSVPTIIQSTVPATFNPAKVPEIPLPDMSAIWDINLDTPEALDLHQSLLREKAKRQLYPQQ